MKNFLKIAALCSVLGAVTTSLLMFLPANSAPTFDDKVLLHDNAFYIGRLWVFFLHPQFNIIAILGVSLLLFRKNPGPVIAGTFFLLMWAVTEAAQQAFVIDAVNQLWRASYFTANDKFMKEAYKINLIGSDGITDSMYFLLLYCFGMGSIFLGIAFIGYDKLGECIGITFLFFGILSLTSFIRYYAGATVLSEIVNACYTWIYSWLQPLARVAIGIWLWKLSVSDGLIKY